MSVLDVEPHDPQSDPMCDAPAALAHHFGSAAQQYDSAKLGMWLFLATEVLLFGGLFVAYAVMRNRHPEVFHYGSQFLDARLGAVNTVILILSSLTMAMAVYAAQTGSWRLLVTCLISTVIGGAGFMSIKYVEYSHKIHEGLVLGVNFYDEPDWVAQQKALGIVGGGDGAAGVGAGGVGVAGAGAGAAGAGGANATGVALAAGDATKGKAIWDSTCRTCHGASGEGLPGSGKPIKGSVFVAAQSDAQLLKFLKVGRAPTDPLNTTGSQMPPKGGNPLLKDGDLASVVAFMRTIAGEPAPGAAAATTTAAAAATTPTTEPLWIPKSSIPIAPEGPAGLSPDFTNPAAAETVGEEVFPHHTVDGDRPANAHLFFTIYYLMTGLHGIHVLIGMLVIGGLTVMAMRGRFGPRSYTAIDLGGLYWHIVDVIWIFLFPLFYLL